MKSINCFFSNKFTTAIRLLGFLFLLICTKSTPVFCTINIGTAERHLQMQNYKEAISAYNTLIAAVDTVAELYYGRGLANYYTDSLDAAIRDFTQAIALKANNDAFLGLANSYILKQQYDNAIKVLTKQINHDSTSDNLLYCRAIAHFMDENYKAAVADFEKTITNANKNKNVTACNYGSYGKAIANYKLQNYAKSKIDLENCVLQNKLGDDYIAKCQELLIFINSM